MIKLLFLEMVVISGLILFISLGTEYHLKLERDLKNKILDQQLEIDNFNYKLKQSLYIGQSYAE